MDKVIERCQVQMANELDWKLKEAKTSMAKMAQEACKRIMQLEKELKASKLEVNQEWRLLFGLQSEIWDKIDQIKMLKIATNSLHTTLNCWGNEGYQQDPNFAPIRCTLVFYGFTIDDNGVALFHSTGITDLVCINPEAPYAPKTCHNLLP
ncbi:3-oxoacyl-[acyl-carrier-protein] synthase [Massospora cicadina]|nr:3-oxoacyl-[acyl-carrier-protein] synthase [Massospora cicadina]